jgi:Zn finger protein HypA/HybF involved in hydrogenase expression
MIPIYMRELEEEVERLRNVEVIPRIKCMQCQCYMEKGTLSFFCLKCSKKRIG